MDKKEMIEFAKQNLVEAMKPLKGIEGLRSPEQVIRDIEDGSGQPNSFFTSITILRNKRFELEYEAAEEGIVFSTCFSNQVVTEEYSNEMLTIYQKKNWIESNVSVLIKLHADKE
jgi:hypothetical protein